MHKVEVIYKKTALKTPSALHKDAKYYFLSDDFLSYYELKKLNSELNLLTLEEDFHDIAEEKQKDFIGLIDQISLETNLKRYWITALASRSAMEIPLFRHFIYIIAAQKILNEEESPSPISFIVDQPIVADTILKLCKSKKRNVKVLGRLEKLRLRSLLYLRSIYYALNTLASFVKSHSSLRKLKKELIPKTQNKRFLIRSWYNSTSFDSEGNYNDRNFGELIEFLTKNSVDLFFLPMPLQSQNPSDYAKEALELARKSEAAGLNFIFPESYISFSDFFALFINCIRLFFLKVSEKKYSNIDFSPLFEWENKSSILNPDRISLNLSGLLIEKLSENSIHFDKFIYTFENNSIEKCFIQSLKKNYPKSEVMAYQHSVWYQSQPSMELAEGESSHHPIPDKIVTSGPIYSKVLENCGFPPERIIQGPNLRFNYIRNYQEQKSPGDYILIVLNYEMNEAMELLYKCSKALTSDKFPKVLVKDHPVNNKAKLKELLENLNATHFNFVSGKLPELIRDSLAVVVGGSSVSCLESLAMGVPLLQIKSGVTTFLDPIWINESPELVGGIFPEARIHEVLDTQPDRTKAMGNIAKTVKDLYFSPVTPSSMKVFLD